MMRTNGEIERDANIAKSLRRIADALEAINEKLAAPVYFTPREAIDAVTANPPISKDGECEQPGAEVEM